MQDEITVPMEEQRAELRQLARVNLPTQLTPLIGREQEVVALCALLRRPEVRLVTLTGTGGIGKTRLGLQVVLHLAGDFADGLSFAPLASISNVNLVIPMIAQALGLGDPLASVSDAALVVPTIAQTLGLEDAAERPVFERLKEFLRDKQLLLLLDNFEQVVTAAPLLADLLMACPGVKALVTSRAVLHIRGEHEFPVPPLASPDPRRLPHFEALSQYAAVALFMQRATAIKPSFKMNDANARIIAELCVRLEGLPLAIELAAAHIKLLSPQALLRRLGHRLQILTGGARDLPERQQTLRNTIKWSYELLSEDEQRLFRRISIFIGGCTLEAIETVCRSSTDTTANIFECVASLIDKSLLQQVEQANGEPRLVMLETIREFGLECLIASGEIDLIRRAHADYALALAEEAEPQMVGAEQAVWLERLEREHDNLRAALHWLVEWEETETALRLSSALYWFWSVHGYMGEGRQWLERALTGSERVAMPVRAKALNRAGALAYNQGDYERVEALCGEGLTLSRALEDKGGCAFSLYWLGQVACWVRHDYVLAASRTEEALTLCKELGDKNGVADVHLLLAYVAMNQGAYDRARPLLEAGLALFRECGDTWGIAYTLHYLARVVFAQGDYMMARTLVEECLAISRQLGYRGGIAYALSILGRLAFQEDDKAAARSLIEESLSLHREANSGSGIAESLMLLAKVNFFQGDYAAARALYEECLAILETVDEKDFLASCIEGLGGVAVAQKQAAWATRLWGAATALREEVGITLSSIEYVEYERAVNAAQAQLGEKTFTALYAEGRAMTPRQALAAQEEVPGDASTESSIKPIRGPLVAGVLPLQSTQPAVAASPPTYAAGLTGREIEVLRLVAMGLTNAQIAEKLTISVLTVNAHLRSIYSKLEVTSRSAATRYAIENKLV